MAWLEQRGNQFRLGIRIGDRKLKRSLQTDNPDVAQQTVSRVERRLKLIEQGDLVLPDRKQMPHAIFELTAASIFSVRALSLFDGFRFFAASSSGRVFDRRYSRTGFSGMKRFFSRISFHPGNNRAKTSEALDEPLKNSDVNFLVKDFFLLDVCTIA